MEIPRIDFDESEDASAPIERAVGLFREHGFVVLDRAFPATLMPRLDAWLRDRHKLDLAGTDRPNRRPLFTVDIEGPIAEPAYFASPTAFAVVRRLLGEDAILGAVSAVVSWPGAPQQFIHRDTEPLFGDAAVEVGLPPYAMTMLVPLVDANAMSGSTRVWPGTHRVPDFETAKQMPSVAAEVPVGSVMLTDSRVLHCGEANRSDAIRPVLYNTYHRPWLRDWGGYEERPPIRFGPGVRRRLGEHAHRFVIGVEGVPGSGR